MAEPLVTGVEAALTRLEALKDLPPVWLAIGLEKAAEMVFDRSQELVPVDTGKLKASGRISRTGDPKTEVVTYFVAYGGDFVGTPEDVILRRGSSNERVRGGEIPRDGPGPAEYAWIVHEDLTKNHAPPTCAKFVEIAVRETESVRLRMLQRLVKLNGTVYGFGGAGSGTEV